MGDRKRLITDITTSMPYDNFQEWSKPLSYTTMFYSFWQICNGGWVLGKNQFFCFCPSCLKKWGTLQISQRQSSHFVNLNYLQTQFKSFFETKKQTKIAVLIFSLRHYIDDKKILKFASRIVANCVCQDKKVCISVKIPEWRSSESNPKYPMMIWLL